MAKPLNEVKEEAEYEMDMQAEFTRRKFTTRGEVQSAVYVEKVQQAIEYVAAGYPTNPGQLNNYPFIKEEAAATEKTPKQVADSILQARQQWIQRMAKIEGVRLGGKQDIRNAVSENNVNTIKDRVKNNLNAVS